MINTGGTGDGHPKLPRMKNHPLQPPSDPASHQDFHSGVRYPENLMNRGLPGMKFPERPITAAGKARLPFFLQHIRGGQDMVDQRVQIMWEAVLYFTPFMHRI